MTTGRQNPDAAAELIHRAAELIKTSANLGGTGRSLSQLEAIAEAVAAERERCAKIADAAVELVKTGHPIQFIPAEQYAADLAREIADAIRNPPPAP